MTSILYVDADSEMCHLVRHVFEETGTMLVYLAGSGEEALTLPVRTRVDAIVSDFNLPGMDGIRLLRHLRLAGIGVPFIFFTNDFMAPLHDVICLPNVFRFDSKNRHDRKEILHLLRIVYWVTGDREMNVMPEIMDDRQ